MKSLSQIILVFCLLLGCNNTQEAPFSRNFEVIELADGIYACIHKLGGKAICNAGIVDLGDKTIIFDSFLSPFVADEIPEIVKKLNLSPIQYVVNSHWHNDHIRGNQIFSSEIDIISTTRTAELIKIKEPGEIAAEKNYAPKRLAYYDSLLNAYQGDSTDREYQNILMWQPYFTALVETNSIIETRLPNVFVDQEKVIKGSKREARLITKGKGHSESDLILFLPDEKIVFTGDLVFIEMHPYLPDGFTDEWKTYLNYIESLGIEKLVPGHGRVGNANDLKIMTEYIEMIEKESGNMIENNIPIEQIMQIKIPEPFTNWWFENFFYWNLEFKYNDLKKNSIQAND